MQVTPAQWGNSLGLRIPKDIAQKAGLKKGEPVEMTVEDGKVVIATTGSRRGRSGLTIDELLSGMTPEAMREAAAEVDLGPDVGREIVDD